MENIGKPHSLVEQVEQTKKISTNSKISDELAELEKEDLIRVA